MVPRSAVSNGERGVVNGESQGSGEAGPALAAVVLGLQTTCVFPAAGDIWHGPPTERDEGVGINGWVSGGVWGCIRACIAKVRTGRGDRRGRMQV
jgi:hypothetical protein